MDKNQQAFRSITEVAKTLNLPSHVLRFWETKFPQIETIKRAGGRRYYRPKDVDLICKIKTLLYEDGYTIRGVQMLLKDEKKLKTNNVIETVKANKNNTSINKQNLIDDLKKIRKEISDILSI